MSILSGNGMQIASLYAKIGANTSEFERAMKRSDSLIGKTGNALGTFVKVGVAGAVAGFAALGTGMAYSLKKAADFDKTMSGAAAVLNTTGTNMKKLNDLALQLGKDTVFSAAEAASAIEMLGKNGVTAEQILAGMGASTVDLAAAVGTDLATAADVATDAMQLFGIRAEDMGKAVNGISGVVVSSKFDIDDYSLALSRGGAVASQVGVSYDDFNAVIAATASSFSSGMTSGTALKTFLQRLVPTTDTARESMKLLGLMTAEGANQFFDAQGKMKSMDQIAKLLSKALNGLSDEAKNTYLFDIFGSEAASMALALGKAGEGGIVAARGIIASTDAAKQASTRMDNLAGDVEQASGSMETLGIKFGKALTPLARAGVQGFTGFLNKLIEMDFSPVTAGLERLFNSLKNAFSGGVNIFEEFAKLGNMDAADALLTINKVFSSWAYGIWKFVRPGLIALWAETYKWIVDPVRRSKILQAVQGAWDAFIRWAGGLWNYIRPALDVTWQSLMSWSTDPLKTNALTNTGLMLVQGLWKWAAGLWGIVSGDLGKFWNYLTSWVSDDKKRTELFAGIGQLFSSFWTWVVGVWDGNGEKVGVKAQLGNFFANMLSWVTEPEKRQQLWDSIVNAWTGFMEWAAWVWGPVSEALGSFWGWLTSWVTDENKRTQLWDSIQKTWTGFTEWAAAVWAWISPVLGNVWTSLTSWITEEEKRSELVKKLSAAWTFFTEWAGSVWEWLSPKLAKMWSDFKSWITDPQRGTDMKNTLAAAWTFITDWGGKIWDWLSPGLDLMWRNLTSWIIDPEKRTTLFNRISGVWTGFWDWARSIWEGTADNPGGLKASLTELGINLGKWIDENVPVLTPWKNEMVGFVQGAAAEWEEKFPKMAATMSDLKDTVIKEVPLIGQAFADLWNEIFGNGQQTGTGFIGTIMEVFNTLGKAIGTTLSQLRIFAEYIVAVVRATKALASGNWDEAAAQGSKMIALWNEFTKITGDQWNAFTDMLANITGGNSNQNGGGNGGGGNGGNGGGNNNTSSQPAFQGTEGMTAEVNGQMWIWRNGGWERLSGYAAGGRVGRSGMALVGEDGPELINMRAGSYVHNASDTAAMLGGQEIHITLDVRGESSLPTDREKLRELARMLMGELRLRGAVVTG